MVRIFMKRWNRVYTHDEACAEACRYVHRVGDLGSEHVFYRRAGMQVQPLQDKLAETQVGKLTCVSYLRLWQALSLQIAQNCLNLNSNSIISCLSAAEEADLYGYQHSWTCKAEANLAAQQSREIGDLKAEAS